MMLSRTASSLYWLGRYLERADFFARLIEATVRLDVMSARPAGEVAWSSAIAVTDTEADFAASGGALTQGDVGLHLREERRRGGDRGRRRIVGKRGAQRRRQAGEARQIARHVEREVAQQLTRRRGRHHLRDMRARWLDRRARRCAEQCHAQDNPAGQRDSLSPHATGLAAPDYDPVNRARRAPARDDLRLTYAVSSLPGFDPLG